MQLVDINGGLKTLFEGLTVSYKGSPIPVDVTMGFPEQEFQARSYPLISLLMIRIDNDRIREDTVMEYYGRDAITFDVFGKLPPFAYNIVYQVDCWSRFHSHLDEILQHILVKLHATSYLEVNTATLSQPVALTDTEIFLVDATDYNIGDTIVLDKSRNCQDYRQAFRVLDFGSNNELLIDEPVQLAFPILGTSVYKARYELSQKIVFADDRQDAARPYYRRTFEFEVMGNLDLSSIENEKYVKTNGVIVNVDVM